MIPLKIALAICFIYLMIESQLRYGKEARSLKTTERDGKSTFYLRILIEVNLLLLLSGFLLNHYKICILFNNPNQAYLGNMIMVTGLIIRVFATKTLKEYYTRTLKIQSNQKIIKTGLYKFVRHPGYLGGIMMWAGAGISSDNYLIMIGIMMISLAIYHYRMNNEEKMLLEAFGEEYQNYKERTWRIIPLIY
ncbi:MAG: isoprenylcysteine carboxylmethyltransferase family protein [Bacteroidales bacterium]